MVGFTWRTSKLVLSSPAFSSFSHVTTIEEVAAAAPVGSGSAETELALVLREVPRGGVCAGGVEPFDLTQALARGSQVGEVQRTRLVVVGQVTELPAVGRPLDDGEGRVRQPSDPLATPLLCLCGRAQEREQDERAEGQPEPSCAHCHKSSMDRAPRNTMSRESDTCTSRLAVGEAAPCRNPPWSHVMRASTARRRADQAHDGRTAMKYTVLIYEREADFKARTDETRKAAYWGAYRAYTQALQEAGIMVRGRRAR